MWVLLALRPILTAFWLLLCNWDDDGDIANPKTVWTSVVVDACRRSHGRVYSQGNATCSRHTGMVGLWFFIIFLMLWSIYSSYCCLENAGKYEF